MIKEKGYELNGDTVKFTYLFHSYGPQWGELFLVKFTYLVHSYAPGGVNYF